MKWGWHGWVGGRTTTVGVEGEEQSLMTCESIGSNLTYLKLKLRREGTKKTIRGNKGYIVCVQIFVDRFK